MSNHPLRPAALGRQGVPAGAAPRPCISHRNTGVYAHALAGSAAGARTPGTPPDPPHPPSLTSTTHLDLFTCAQIMPRNFKSWQSMWYEKSKDVPPARGTCCAVGHPRPVGHLAQIEGPCRTNPAGKPHVSGPTSALQELPGHDHALDLAGALVDLGDRGPADSFRRSAPRREPWCQHGFSTACSR
jgi:hypothetical protein